MALAGLGKIGGVGPSGDLAPSPDTPEVAGTEEPQTERAVSPESGLLGVLFCGGPDVEAELTRCAKANTQRVGTDDFAAWRRLRRL
jgi:hypothetical protein